MPRMRSAVGQRLCSRAGRGGSMRRWLLLLCYKIAHEYSNVCTYSLIPPDCCDLCFPRKTGRVVGTPPPCFYLQFYAHTWDRALARRTACPILGKTMFAAFALVPAFSCATGMRVRGAGDEISVIGMAYQGNRLKFTPSISVVDFGIIGIMSFPLSMSNILAQLPLR